MENVAQSLPPLSSPDPMNSSHAEMAIYTGVLMGKMEHPLELRSLRLAIHPTYCILVCAGCRYVIQQPSLQGQFKHEHLKSKYFSFEMDEILDKLNITYNVAAPTKMVPLIPCILVVDSYKCVEGCLYVAPSMESVKMHHRKVHHGMGEPRFHFFG
jgi:Orsellinic acid/F9775 biosynthesis cluster protein D